MEHNNNDYDVTVLSDSISSENHRLTSLLVTFPRCVLSEFNTHRQFSRNSASSRAIPVTKQLKRVMDHPFIPAEAGKNKSGMQAGENLSPDQLQELQSNILIQRDRAILGCFENLMGSARVEEIIKTAKIDILMHGFTDETQECFTRLLKEYEDGDKSEMLNVHKETVNRYLEPYMWHTVIVSATEWSNFFALRCHDNADPKIRKAADLMKDAMNTSTPQLLGPDEWHTPFLSEDEKLLLADGDTSWLSVSAARCARISYLTHDGTRNVDKDLELANRLLNAGHMSPFEHVARAEDIYNSNFIGWAQLRKMIPYENDFSLRA